MGIYIESHYQLKEVGHFSDYTFVLTHNNYSEDWRIFMCKKFGAEYTTRVNKWIVETVKHYQQEKRDEIERISKKI